MPRQIDDVRAHHVSAVTRTMFVPSLRTMACFSVATVIPALTQRADDWYALYARAAKERTAALEDVERWKKAAESNIEENVGLRLAEEGAKEAFAHVVQQKRDFEAECKRLRGLLDGAHDTIRRQAVTPNVEVKAAPSGVGP